KGKQLFAGSLKFKRIENCIEKLRELSLPPIFVFDGTKEEMDFGICQNDIERTNAKVLFERFPPGCKVFDELSEANSKYGLIELSTIGDYNDLLVAQKEIQNLLPADLQVIVVKNC